MRAPYRLLTKGSYKTNRSADFDSDLVITREEDGRYYDPRLGHLTDAMYSFATRNHMDLWPRHTAWYFTWTYLEIDRSIQVNPIEEPNGYRIEFVPSAKIDDLKRGFCFLPSTRLRHTLELPVSRGEFNHLLAE